MKEPRLKNNMDTKETKIIENFYDWVRERYEEYGKEMPNSPTEKGKKTGRLDILTQLLHYLKHYEEYEGK